MRRRATLATLLIAAAGARHPGACAGQAPWHVDPSPVLAVGSPAGQDAFTRVTRALLLPGGRIAVVDAGERHVVIFDADGRRTVTLGRPGAGLGEFQSIGWVGLRGDTILIADAVTLRLTRFGLDGRLVNSMSVARAGAARVIGQLSDSIMLVSTPSSPRRDGPQRVYRDSVRVGLLNVASDGPVQWLGTFPGPSFLVINPSGAAEGQAVAVAPMRPFLAWATIGDRFALGDTEHDRLTVYDQAGREVTAWSLGIAPRRVNNDDVREVQAEYVARTGGTGPAWLREALFSPKTLPDMLPTYGGVRGMRDGNLWVQEYSPTQRGVDAERVYTATGRLLARVTLPAGARLQDVLGARLLAIVEDEDGVQSVAVFRLEMR